MSNNFKNRTSKSSRGGRGRKNYKREVRIVPKYNGPTVGTEEYRKLHTDKMVHKFSDKDTLDRKFIPHVFK